jgi:drug/metabolite transporter (DMT)-like permease
MRRYSPLRISAVVLSLTWVGLLTVGFRQTADQDFSLDWKVWALFAFAVLGPLVVTNVLWYTALHRVGPSRATLAANLQPFVAAVFAVILLDEHITAMQIAGGALIAAGILLARRRVRSEA